MASLTIAAFRFVYPQTLLSFSSPDPFTRLQALAGVETNTVLRHMQQTFKPEFSLRANKLSASPIKEEPVKAASPSSWPGEVPILCFARIPSSVQTCCSDFQRRLDHPKADSFSGCREDVQYELRKSLRTRMYDETLRITVLFTGSFETSFFPVFRMSSHKSSAAPPYWILGFTPSNCGKVKQ